MVMDLSAPVKASASISKDGKTTTVTLKNTKLKTAKENITMDSSIANSAKLSQVPSRVVLIAIRYHTSWVDIQGLTKDPSLAESTNSPESAVHRSVH